METMPETAKLTCRRKVKVKSKTKLCGCPDNICPVYEDARAGKKKGGFCSNHCIDADCGLHNPYTDYNRRK